MSRSVLRQASALSAAAVLALLPTIGAALSNPNDFCTGNPCNITSAKTADSGITLDFGNRTVVLSEVLTIGNDSMSGFVGSLTILAANFHIVGNGQIKANAIANPAGSITITTTGNIQVDGTRSTGAFRMSGTDGGTIVLNAGGNVTGAGRFNIENDSIQGAGGELLINTQGSVTLTGPIAAGGGAFGFGGTIEVVSIGNVSLSGLIDVSGGESGGGSLDLFSEANITLGQIDMSAGGEFGDAGIGDILALGDLTFNGTVIGSGADNGELCGDAADFDVTADGTLRINAAWTMRGRGLDCSGGFVAIDGNAVNIAAAIDLQSTGTEGVGGDLDVSSVAPMIITGKLNLDGTDGSGDLFLTSDSDMTISNDIIANGRGTFGSGASLVEIDATGSLVLSGDIIASGGSQGSGGDVSLDACSVLQTATSVIDARATGGLIGIIATDDLTLQGSFLGEPTSVNAIDIRWGPAADPPLITATFNVPPTLTMSPLLEPCALCASNAECNDSNPCTNDVCVPATGCTNPAVNLIPCNDGNACTTGDFCAFTFCFSGPPTVCNDGDVCTDDSCDSLLGCRAVDNTAPCNDLDGCTEDDVCAAGECAGEPVDCEDGNPCTDNTCTLGLCQSTNNNDGCDDDDVCTLSDVCSGGACQPGAPLDCQDTDVCTTDSCDSETGCFNDPIVGCADGDGDGVLDDEDVCTTLDWTASPQTPPNQQPSKLLVNAKKLAEPLGEQNLLFKGFFNVAAPAQAIVPEVDGIHFALYDGGGLLYEVDVPGGIAGNPANCDPRDGWQVAFGEKTKWKYSNRSGALPPACIPGSARGISSIQIKDLRSGGKAALQAKVKVKGGDFVRVPTQPLEHIQADLVLSARPAPGVASDAAINGQCAEAVITGNPIRGSSPKPFCKKSLRDGILDKVTCKGE